MTEGRGEVLESRVWREEFFWFLRVVFCAEK